MNELGDIVERLAGNCYVLDEELSHIRLDQDAIRRTGVGPLLVRICPAHVYSEGADGRVDVDYAGCLECGTCLALVPACAINWHYPRGGFGVVYRQG